MLSYAPQKQENQARPSDTLAVLSPHIGILSQTFVHKHTTELYPGKTIVVTHSDEYSSDVAKFQGPVLFGHPSPSKRKLLYQALGYEVDKRFLDFFKHHKTKVILGEFLDHTLPFIPISQKLDVPLFAHAHGYDISQRLLSPRYRKLYLKYRKASGIITMTEYSRDKLIRIGLAPEKIYIIPCGVVTESEATKKAEKDFISCVAIGRMVAKKAPLLLLESFRLASKDHPNLCLDFIGDGPLFPMVQKFVQDHDLADRVRLHGAQPHEVVQSFLREADIYLQHSIVDPDTGDEEGLPVTILEAMSLCTPVVSTRHAGIPEAVLDGESGFLVDEQDCFMMADRIIMLAEDKVLREKFGKAAWQTIKDRFSWEKEKADLLQLLQLHS